MADNWLLAKGAAAAEMKAYVDDTLKEAGALKGVPCQIDSIESITGGKRVNFVWEDNEGQEHTDHMDVMDGEDGKDGTDGTDGTDGKDGKDGRDGIDAIPAKVVSEETSYSTALEADKYYKFGELTSFALSCDNTWLTDTEHMHEYMFEFESGSTPTTFTYDSTNLVLLDEDFTVEASSKYQGSVLEGIIIIAKVG